MKVPALVEAIKQALAIGAPPPRVVESVAAILERSAPDSIQDWFEHVLLEKRLMAIPLSRDQRCSHLPQLFRDLVTRLHSFKDLGSRELVSAAAAEHGGNTP